MFVLPFIFLKVLITAVNAQTFLSELTFFSDKVEWSVAYDVCEKTGARLINVDSKLRQETVTKKWLEFELFRTPDSTYWIHDDRWQTNFYGLSLNYDLPLCLQIRAEIMAEDVTDCQDLSYFICKRSLGTRCSFQHIKEVRLSLDGGGFYTKTSKNGSSEDCIEACRTFNSEQGECWAASYTDNHLEPAECHLHYGMDQSLIRGPDLRATHANYTLFLKQCLSVELKPVGYVDWLLSQTTDAETSTAKPTNITTEQNTGMPTTSLMESDETSPEMKTSSIRPTKPNPVSRSTAAIIPNHLATTDLTTSGTFKPSSGTFKPSSGTFTPTGVILTTPKPLHSTPITQMSNNTRITMSKSSASISTSIMTVSTPEYNNTAGVDGDGYQCACICPVISQEEPSIFLETILEPLRLNSSNLSSSRRRYSSAPDDRPSSQVVGYLSGLFIILAVLIIVSADLITIKRFCKTNHHDHREIL